MRTFNKFKDTRDFVRYSLQYVHGAILDLGAGRAKYRALIREYGDSYTALDVFEMPGVDVVSSIDQTPFAEDSFDTIYCTQVFEHIPKPWLAVEEIKRILKSGGYAIVTVPFLQAYHADPDDYFRYTVQGLESLFDSAEFEIIESGAWGGAGTVLIDMLRKKYFSAYKPQRRGTWRLTKLLVALGHVMDGKAKEDPIIYQNVFVVVRKSK